MSNIAGYNIGPCGWLGNEPGAGHEIGLFLGCKEIKLRSVHLATCTGRRELNAPNHIIGFM